MTTRIRILSVQVTPHLVMDDGETLTPIETTPAMLTAADLAAFPEMLREQIAAEEARLNAED